MVTRHAPAVAAVGFHTCYQAAVCSVVQQVGLKAGKLAALIEPEHQRGVHAQLAAEVAAAAAGHL